MKFGNDIYTMSFAQVERLEAQTDEERGPLIYLKGAVVNRKGKTETKDYKLFAPSAEVVEKWKRGGRSSVAECKKCESWTTEVVKLINRSKAGRQVKSN